MKILIADDDDYTREGLVESIDWSRFGIEEVVQARNGSEAKSIAAWFQPDIVLTDIKMPKLDGISFAHELAEMNPSCMLIFMSGYMEIDYLKSAIKLSAVDFIEKPIDLMGVEKAIEKAIAAIHERRSAADMKENRKELLQQKLVNILISKDFDYEMAKKLCGDVDFSLKRNYYCVIIHDNEKRSNTEEVINLVTDFFDQKRMQAIGNYAGDYSYTFIIACDTKEKYRMSGVFQAFLSQYTNFILGVGFDTNDIRSIHNGYQTALLAMNCSFYDNTNRIFYVDDEIMQQRNLEPGLYNEFVGLLREHPYNLKEWCDKVFDNLKTNKYYRKEQVQALFTSMIIVLCRENREVLDGSEHLDNEEKIELAIRNQDKLEGIRRLLFKLITKLEERYQEQSQYSRLIRGVTNYISNHYGEAELSVSQIAEYFHFSSAYLSVLFKQEMNITLKQYISNVRIERAKKMLELDYDKITEIAIKCGYANANYFAKVFKEVTGMTPIEYREDKLNTSAQKN
ncbi:helix-turn-helix domain-containing protein [Anaerosporobacter sp.]|uniref:helix-turn-helix domain-containing protein n=1 Tax=Anaerosporobacter sp. TaxID=1872529 RepID=UPI00286F867F|nr:response regulator [Anaerosporobacter sp.]